MEFLARDLDVIWRETSGSVAKCRLFPQARITQTMGARLGL